MRRLIEGLDELAGHDVVRARRGSPTRPEASRRPGPMALWRRLVGRRALPATLAPANKPTV